MARELVQLGDVTPNNIGQLKKLNSVIFPVSYTPSFYTKLFEGTPPAHQAKLAYYNDCAVGAVCFRKEPVGDKKHFKLYIMTLGALAPYRRLGVGTALLNHVLAQCAADKSVTSVYLHVQTSNDEARAFYEHHGFSVASTEKGYYSNLDPADAFVLEKKFEPST